MDATAKRKLDSQFAAARSLDPGQVIPDKERYQHSVEDAAAGDYIRFDNKTYVVRELGVYEETDEAFAKKTGDAWTELRLFCVDDGSIVHLEWEKDDEVEVSITERALTFADLKDDRGGALDEDDLDDLADEEDCVFWEGKEFSYDDDYPALYARQEAGASTEKVYFYDFVAGDGRQITVEEWNSGSGREKYQIFMSRGMSPDSVERVARSG